MNSVSVARRRYPATVFVPVNLSFKMRITFLVLCTIACVWSTSAHAQTLDVHAFGAKGDGTTDDTASIQSALNAAAQGGGGVVLLPAGTYLTSNSLLVPSKTHMKGEARGRTVIVSPAGDYPGRTVNGAQVYATIAMVGVDSAKVSDLTVDHRTYGTTANGVALLPDGASYTGTVTTNSVVQNVEVLGYSSHQYLIWNLRGARNKILGNFLDGGVPDSSTIPEEGIELFGAQSVLVTGNTVRNVGNNAIYISAGSDVPGSTLRDVIVTDNQVENARVGIYLSVGAYDATQISIKNNNVSNTWTSGIALTAGVATVKDVDISGNNIVNTVNEGIRLLGTSGGTYSNLKANDNVIDNVTGPNGFGIIANGLSNTSINHNSIKNTVYGLYVTGNASNIDIAGNRVEEQTKNAVFVGAAANVGISANHFRNYDKAGGRNPGVYTESLAGGRVVGNEFKYATTESYAVWITRNSSDVKIAQNILNYTAVFTPPLRNDGSSPSSDVLYGDVTLPTTFTGVILKDRATGVKYRVIVVNGILTVEPAP